MTTAQFIAAVEAKPQFIKWATVPIMVEQVGLIQKWNGVAFINTTDGTNLFNVSFLVDDAENATWQNLDTLTDANNTNTSKQIALATYLKTNFDAYFIERTDFENNWAIATVYKAGGAPVTLTKSTVLVYKKGTNPIAHLVIN